MKLKRFTKRYTKKTRKQRNKNNKNNKYKNIRKSLKTKKNTRRKQIKQIKQQKKKYIGGDHDSFMRNYEANLEKIQTAILRTSGSHLIDIDSANSFIERQISPVRRQAARDLIENTEYITLEEMSRTIEQLIIRLYEEYHLNESTEPIYFVCGKPEKSNYFITVLGLFYIRKNHFREPLFIDDLNDDILNDIGTNPLIIMDDVAYSGSQLSDQMDKIYYDRVIEQKLVTPRIFILVAGLNKISLRRLTRVPSNKLIGKYFDNYIESPFTLLYMPDKLYDPLLLKIGIERYSYVNLFFSPYTKGIFPFVSIYLDHKVADAVSTYLKALVYGPIVPANYDYQYLYGDEHMDNSGFFGFHIDLTPDEKEQLMSKFNEENGTSFKINERDIGRELGMYMLNKLKTIDNIDDEYKELNHLTFSPFINTCKDDPEIISNISDEEIINFNYSLFIATGKDDIPSPSKPKYSYNPIEFYTYEIAKNNGIRLRKVLEINSKIESFRCPKSWYKEGPLAMV